MPTLWGHEDAQLNSGCVCTEHWCAPGLAHVLMSNVNVFSHSAFTLKHAATRLCVLKHAAAGWCVLKHTAARWCCDSQPVYCKLPSSTYSLFMLRGRSVLSSSFSSVNMLGEVLNKPFQVVRYYVCMSARWSRSLQNHSVHLCKQDLTIASQFLALIAHCTLQSIP